MGDAAGFSFYPAKNLGAYGDGGGLTTNDEALADRVCMIRNYGQGKKYHHDVAGWNSRLDTLQAAVLSAKLEYLPAANAARRTIAASYRERLCNLPIEIPVERKYVEHVYHQFVILVERRDEMRTFLDERGVQTGIHYPEPLHKLSAFAGEGFSKGTFPVTEATAKKLVSLPIFPSLTEMEIDRVCETIASFYSQG